MSSHIGVARDSEGNAVASVEVTVYENGTATPASIFSDEGLGTPLANPFTSDADGVYQFYAASDLYDIELSKTGFDTIKYENVPVGFGVPSSRTINATSPVRIDGGASADLSADRTLSLDLPSLDHGSIGGLGDDDHTQYVHTSVARNISVAHTFNPSVGNVPFDVGPAGTGVVLRLNADQVDNIEGAEIIQRDGSVAFTAVVSGVDPTLGPHLATKDYVDGLGGAVDVRRCKVTDSSDQTIANSTLVAVNWDTELYDTDGFHDNVTNNNRLTVPAGAGNVYMLVCGIVWAPNASGVRRVMIRKNGTTVLASHRSNAVDSGETHASLIAFDDAGVGDYYEVLVEQTSGGNLDLQTTTDGSFFAIEGGQPD